MENDAKRLLQARALELLALSMIGDGALALLQPERHMRLWRAGPRPWRELVEFFHERPGLTRVVGVGAIAAGLWLAGRQSPR